MITTLAEVKARLGITSTTNDAQITAIIDEVELEFIELTKNRFLLRDVYVISSEPTFDTTTITVSNVDFTDADREFIAGWVYVSGSVHNDGYHQVTDVAETTLTVVDNLVTEDSGNSITIQQVKFPTELKSIIAEMVGEVIAVDSRGIKSESIGSRSVTYTDGYSKSLKSKITKYKRLYW